MKSFFLGIGLILIFITSCNKKAVVRDISGAKMEIKADKTELPDCLADSANIGRENDQEGTIIIVTDIKMISFNGSSRINPCFMPEGFEEGDQVLFSGVVKKSPDGVRLAGTPFRLTSIVKK